VGDARGLNRGDGAKETPTADLLCDCSLLFYGPGESIGDSRSSRNERSKARAEREREREGRTERRPLSLRGGGVERHERGW